MSCREEIQISGVWSEEEHDRFLAALKLYPNGPWKAVADHVGTRSTRQTQTHAQRYYAKVARRVRGLRKDRKKVARSEHRLDDDMVEICEVGVDGDGDVVQVHRHPSRRELNAIVMRKRDDIGTNSTDEGAIATGGGVDATEEALARRSDSAEEDSDSLSSLGDEDLDYLLEILASRELASGDQ